MQAESLGTAIKMGDDYNNYWCNIGHFFRTPFYVYAYTFGDCLVNSLYSLYQSGRDPDFTQKYITLLKAGGTLHHKELLSPFGLDASNPNFWLGGLTVIENFIDQLKNIPE